MFAYTDGLVEARRGGELYGSERLARLAAGWAATLGPEALVRAVHEEIAGLGRGPQRRRGRARAAAPHLSAVRARSTAPPLTGASA